MYGAIILVAAIAAVGAPTADAPQAPRVAAGPWRLTQVGGKVGCTVNLTDHTAPGGQDVKFPSVCRRAFPALKDLAAWSVDPQGSLVFANARGQRIVALAGSPGGSYEAKTADGTVLHLESAPSAPSPTPPAGLSGAFSLTGSGGTVLCDLVLRANVFGESGRVISRSCAAGWTDKDFAVWSLRQGRLTLMDRSRRPILVLKAGDTGIFVSVESKADPITLVRRRPPHGLSLDAHEALRDRQAGQRHPLA